MSEPGRHSAPVASARVEVNLVGDLGGEGALGALLREWLDSNEIAHSIESQPSLALADLRTSRASGPPVRIWLVLRTPQQLRLYLTEPGEQRYLVRDIPLPSGLDELGRERAAQVVLTSALAFLERRASTPWTEVERAFSEPVASKGPAPGGSATQRPSEPRVPNQGREPGPTWELGAGAWYTVVGSDGPAHGPGALFEFGASTKHARFAAVMRGHYRFWPEASSPRVRIEARGPELGLGAAAELVLGASLRAFLEAGAGTDFVVVTPHEVPGSNVDARPPQNDARAFAVLSGGLRWRSHSFWASVGARAEWELGETHYDVATGRDIERELSMPRLRPGGFLEVGFLTTVSD